MSDFLGSSIANDFLAARGLPTNAIAQFAGTAPLDAPKTIEHVFFDCDDCCYQNNWSTADKITKSIASYVADLGVTEERAYDLYLRHGTCLKGLLIEGIIDQAGVEDFLLKVHLISYEDIHPDPALRHIISTLTGKHYVFTASTSEHAMRCLSRLGVADLFQVVVDTRVCGLETKHSEAAFRAAMQSAGATDPTTCMLLDDSIYNIKRAKTMGWRTVLVGFYDRKTGERHFCDEADHHIATIHQLPDVCPDLYPAPQHHDLFLNRVQSMGV